MTTDTPEYKAIDSCRTDLTEMLSTCFKKVANCLRDSGELTKDQCKIIMEARSPEASADMLIDTITVYIKSNPLDVFAEFVTAMKSSGNKHFKDFVKKNIEAKRKELYRKLLQIPRGFVASQEYDVFISYSHEADTIQMVDKHLCPLLTKEGLTWFVDRDGLRPGDRWQPKIASAIKTCKAFVVVLTKRYMRSAYCNGELYEAEALGKPLFPVECENGWEGVLGGAPVREIVKERQYISLVAEDSQKQLTKDLVPSIKRECSGATGQKRKLSARETSSPKRTESISSRGGCSGAAGQKIMLPVLTIDNLQHVYEKLQGASPRWLDLGLALGLSKFILTNIDSKNRGDNVVCLREMLTELLNTKYVTWSLLSDALKNPTVNLIHLADSITATT